MINDDFERPSRLWAGSPLGRGSWVDQAMDFSKIPALVPTSKFLLWGLFLSPLSLMVDYNLHAEINLFLPLLPVPVFIRDKLE